MCWTLFLGNFAIFILKPASMQNLVKRIRLSKNTRSVTYEARIHVTQNSLAIPRTIVAFAHTIFSTFFHPRLPARAVRNIRLPYVDGIFEKSVQRVSPHLAMTIKIRESRERVQRRWNVTVRSSIVFFDGSEKPFYAESSTIFPKKNQIFPKC